MGAPTGPQGWGTGLIQNQTRPQSSRQGTSASHISAQHPLYLKPHLVCGTLTLRELLLLKAATSSCVVSSSFSCLSCEAAAARQEPHPDFRRARDSGQSESSIWAHPVLGPNSLHSIYSLLSTRVITGCQSVCPLKPLYENYGWSSQFISRSPSYIL
jgi:hypothetical protein